MKPHMEIHNQIEKEFAAIEQGCFALLYMLRKMRDTSIVIAAIPRQNGEFDPVLDNLLKEDMEAIQHIRKGIGHLIEDAGNFMDGTDMNVDMDMRCTDLAYELHQALPDNCDPKWMPHGVDFPSPVTPTLGKE
jgi:hypothetical protein